jgi:urate oxidase
MEQFASGWKRNYYGKGDVIVYRLKRDGVPASGGSPVFGANVLMLLYGNAFWPTYTTGDNTGLIATDSMKNFIQRETLGFPGSDLEDYCRYLASRFLSLYPQVEGLQVSAAEIPFAGEKSFSPAGPERAAARIELDRSGIVEIASAVRGYRLLRLGGSAFHGFVRDQYTTLPEIRNRPLHMWLDVEWTYTDPSRAFSGGSTTAAVRRIVREVFEGFESGSIQQMIYQMGSQILAGQETIAEIRLEANNRTWDTVVEKGDELGVFTDARPPYGCLGLRLRR